MVRKKMMWLAVAAVVILSAEYGFGQIIPAAEAAAGRAVVAGERENYSESLNEINEAIRIDPSGEGGKYYVIRAMAYCGLGLCEIGIVDLRTWESIGNVTHPYLRNMAISTLNYCNNGCRMNANNGVRSQKAAAEAAFNRGVKAYNNDNYDLAIKEYTEAIRLDPSLDGAYANRGGAYLEKAYKEKYSYDNTISDCNQAIRMNPNNAEAYNYRGQAYLQKQNYAKAKEDLEKYFRLNPNSDSVRAKVALSSARALAK